MRLFMRNGWALYVDHLGDECAAFEWAALAWGNKDYTLKAHAYTERDVGLDCLEFLT